MKNNTKRATATATTLNQLFNIEGEGKQLFPFHGTSALPLARSSTRHPIIKLKRKEGRKEGRSHLLPTEIIVIKMAITNIVKFALN